MDERASGSAPTRGADKYTFVANEMRRRIAAGEFAPGDQIPHRAELERAFRVSRVTLQRAMNLLIEDGFISATRSKGSFVAERPPHLSRYALAFQASPDRTESWSRFWMALANEAARRERAEPCDIPLFYGIDGHTDTADYGRLAASIEEHRLAGIVYVADYPHPPDHSLLRRNGMAAVQISSHLYSAAGEPSDASGVPSVTIDEESFVHKALDYLHDRGRRRVAFVGPPEYVQRRTEFLLQQAAARGMTLRPYWIQGIGLEAPFVARNCVHLLMNPDQRERPDALVITDDNLVEPATVGLAASGVAAPGAVDAVAHANFPWKTPSVVPARRLGYDVPSLLESCLRLIDAQRRGEMALPYLQVPARFEEDLPG